MLNRDERRAYWRRNKKNKNLSKCPKCGFSALFYSTARGENDTVIKCDICQNIVFEGPDVTRLVPPGIYLPLPLDIFEIALKNPPKEENNNIQEAEYVEVKEDD